MSLNIPIALRGIFIFFAFGTNAINDNDDMGGSGRCSTASFRYIFSREVNLADESNPSFENVESLADCAAICESRRQQGCTGFTWFKDGRSDRVPNLTSLTCTVVERGELSESDLRPLAGAISGFLVQPMFSIDHFRTFINLDYFGSDLSSVSNVETAEDCAGICLDRLVMGCTGFTWLDRHSKYPERCFLKKKELSETHLSELHGAYTGLLNQPVLSIENFRSFVNFDYIGSDLVPFMDNVNSTESCAAVCRSRLLQGCSGFTWFGSAAATPNRCVPKIGELAETKLCGSSGAVTGFLTQPVFSIADFSSYFNQNYVGNDLSPFVGNVTSPEACAAICRTRKPDGCTGFTWFGNTTEHANRCVPKREELSKTHLTPSPGAITGLAIRPVVSISFRSFVNLDYVGNDLTSVNNVNSTEGCAALCRVKRERGCTGFTWLNSTTRYPNTCFLKRAKLFESHLSEFLGAVTGFLLEPFSIVDNFSFYANVVHYDQNNLTPLVDNVTSAEACATICLERLHLGCAGFSWLGSDGDTQNRCIPKSGELSERGLAEYIGATTGMLNQPTRHISNFRSFTNKDYYGKDLVPFVLNVNSAEECAAICWARLEEGCSGFTWLDGSTQYPNRCHPKTGKLFETHLSVLLGATTGLLGVPEFSSDGFRSFVNRDYPDSDLVPFVANVDIPEDCARHCADRLGEGCTGFSWIDTESRPKRCHLKGGDLVEAKLSEAAGAVTGFIDTLGRSSDVHFALDKAGGFSGSILDAFLTGQWDVNHPSDCANICSDRFADGCTGFNWTPRRGSLAPRCIFYRGTLLTRNLYRSDGDIAGILQPLCSEGGFRVFSGTAVANDRVPVNTLSPSTGSACRTFFENQNPNGAFYDFFLDSDGVGTCRVYSAGFDLSFLTTNSSSATSVPCEPHRCLNGFKVYSERSVDTKRVAPIFAFSALAEAECRSTLQFYHATFSTFRSLGTRKGTCEVYNTPFEESLLLFEGTSSTVVRCEPSVRLNPA